MTSPTALPALRMYAGHPPQTGHPVHLHRHISGTTQPESPRLPGLLGRHADYLSATEGVLNARL